MNKNYNLNNLAWRGHGILFKLRKTHESLGKVSLIVSCATYLGHQPQIHNHRLLTMEGSQGRFFTEQESYRQNKTA